MNYPGYADNNLLNAQIDYYAQRHLWLGQYELAVDKQPRLAVQQFRLANHMTNGRDPICGTSIYDEALCDYYQHDFQQSVDFYRHVLRIRPIPNGFDRSDASLMLRHAMACLGYHEGNSKLGIPEPPILDPFCGAAALAEAIEECILLEGQREVNNAEKCVNDISHNMMPGTGPSGQPIFGNPTVYPLPWPGGGGFSPPILAPL